MAKTDKRPLLAFLKVQEDAEREILYQLKRAAAQAARDIKRLSGGNFSDQIRADQMRLVRQSLLEQQAEIWESVGNTVQAGRVRAAAAAIETNALYDQMLLEAVLDEDSVAVLKDAAKLTSQRGVELITVREMGYSRYPLSEQVYKTRALSEGMIDRKIQSALARGLSAREFAAEIVDFIRPDTPGGVQYAAMRLARTELNNAFHAVAVKDAQDKPWVATMKWNLSGSHPVPDECNDYAEDTHFKGGEAGQFKKEQVPAKPHPNCLCYVTPEVMDTDAFIEGYFNGDFDAHIDDVMRKAGYPARADGRLIGPIGGASGTGLNAANGAIVAARRQALGLSRPQVAARVGDDMTVAKLARIELKGGTDDEIRRVARALDLPEDRLVGATAAAPAPAPVATAARAAATPPPTSAQPIAPKPSFDKLKIDKKNENVVRGWPVTDAQGNVVGYIKKVETRTPNYVPGTRYASGFTKSTYYDVYDATGSKLGSGYHRNQTRALDDLKARLRKQADQNVQPKAPAPVPTRTITQPPPPPPPAASVAPPPGVPTTTAPGLRAQREALKLSRTDISNRSGLSVAKVARIETKGGTADELAAYQRALGTPGPPPATTVVPTPPPVRPTVQTRRGLAEWDDARLEQIHNRATKMEESSRNWRDLGDQRLLGLYEEQGFNALPRIIANAEFDALSRRDWHIVYRGINGQSRMRFIEQYRTGDHFPGLGVYGNGTYSSTVADTAVDYAGGDLSATLTMAFRKDARIIDYEDAFGKWQKDKRILKEQKDAAWDAYYAIDYRDTAARATAQRTIDLLRIREDTMSDVGRWAVMHGYDAIVVDKNKRENYFVILNRGAVVIRKTTKIPRS